MDQIAKSPHNQSAQPCGCDPGAHYLCERHTKEFIGPCADVGPSYPLDRLNQRTLDELSGIGQSGVPYRGESAARNDKTLGEVAAKMREEERIWRKQRPLYSGVLMYFPDALLEVAYCSYKGNEQHNPGEPLHWAKEKSQDELDAMARHSLEAGTKDSDGVRHSAKIAWRALANLQREIDKEKEGR